MYLYTVMVNSGKQQVSMKHTARTASAVCEVLEEAECHG